MDPWLEGPIVWTDVHNSLITSIRDRLADELVPRYFIGVEARTMILSPGEVERLYRPDLTIVSGRPDAARPGAGAAVLEPPRTGPIAVELLLEDEVEEIYLTVQKLPERTVVTVLEILSPSNKVSSEGRKEYLKKRDQYLLAGANLVEIDLLRSGEPTPLRGRVPDSDYRILVCREPHQPGATLYPFNYRDPIPPVPIPLLPGEPEPSVDLNAIFHDLVKRARYDIIIDYEKPPIPPLRPEDEPWAAAIVAEASRPAD
jgi:hypothetical protein